MKLFRELLESELDNPYQPGTYINTCWIGYRESRHPNDGMNLKPFSTIQIVDSEPFYKSDPKGLWTVYFLYNGNACRGLFSSEDFPTSFFKGTKREYHLHFLNGLKDE